METFQSSERPPFSSMLIIIGFVIIGMVIGNILAVAIMMVVGGIGVNQLTNVNELLVSSPTGWLALMLGQAAASLVTFVAAGVIYWKLVEGKNLHDFNFRPTPPTFVFLFAIVIQVFFMPVNGWLQVFNENMKFPAFLKDLEGILKGMEESLAGMTKFMTTFDSFGQYILAFIVIAIIAGVGEELIFRGLIQRKLQLGFKNPHLAIWVAAFIFSAIHFQFYGFLPRLMLGALFGYFYYFTGNLWVPIIAHIFNNGLAVTLLYLSHKKQISADLENIDKVPFAAAAACLMVTGGLLWYFQQYTASGVNRSKEF